MAIRAQSEAWNRYRIGFDDFNRRLLVNSSGWTLILRQLGLPDLAGQREAGLLRLFEYMRDKGTSLAVVPEVLGCLSNHKPAVGGTNRNLGIIDALIVLGTTSLY